MTELYMEFLSNLHWRRDMRSYGLDEGTRVRYSLNTLAEIQNSNDIADIKNHCTRTDHECTTNASSKERFRLLLANKMLLNTIDRPTLYRQVQVMRRDRNWQETFEPAYSLPFMNYEYLGEQKAKINEEIVNIVQLQNDGGVLLIQYPTYNEVWSTNIEDNADPNKEMITLHHGILMRMKNPSGLMLKQYTKLSL